MSEPNDGDGLNPGQGEQSQDDRGTRQDSDFTSELAAKISETEAYKSLQRALSKNANETNAVRAENENLKKTLNEYQKWMEEYKVVTEWQASQLVSMLPEEDRNAALQELNQRNREMQSARELAELRRQVESRQQTQQPVANDKDLRELMEKVERETMESFEEHVVAAGFDKSTKGLDFGQPGTPFATRLKALNASITKLKKAKVEEEAESLKRKDGATTRTAVSSPSLAVGRVSKDDLLKQAAALMRAK